MKKKKLWLLLTVVMALVFAAGCNKKEKVIEYDANYYQSLTGETKELLTESPEVFILHTKDELTDYYEKNKESYDLSELHDQLEKYDDSYFKKQDLILIVFRESSGAVTHEVSDVAYENGAWKVSIKRNAPAAGISNIAWWHIVLEIKDIKLGADGYSDKIEISVL